MNVMNVQHPLDPRQAFPLLSAFGMEGDVEDGLTDSHRPVLAADLCRKAPERPLEPQESEQEDGPWVDPVCPPHPVVRRVEGFLGRWGRWSSARVANEELGDALELIHKLAAVGVPGWMLYAQAGVAAFWALVHTVQDAALRLTRRQRVER
ncbi:hypothetical protein [Archangium violaceum]|uniref:Uncharacterized protein n=1 Tax=Archangium violaceum Cb vi76 TaxID=1406225 RepID=A0A084SX09_9BACT|nr:hypothetical protein [Archangium violaceum]KFA92994.1 hypothetical protein Q664_11975 [Archangium violaceum Cb vi76]